MIEQEIKPGMALAKVEPIQRLFGLAGLLEETFTTWEDVKLWMNQPNRYLTMFSKGSLKLRPIDMVRKHRENRVHAALEALNSGIFL